MQLEKHGHQLRGTLSRDVVKALQHICSDAAGCVNVMQLQLWHITDTERHGWVCRLKPPQSCSQMRQHITLMLSIVYHRGGIYTDMHEAND